MSTAPSDTGVRTVLLCDDQRELRDAISLLLGNFPRYRVVGHAVDAASCLLRIADSRPDIVIMDVSLPGGGVELVRNARIGRPDLHIVMFSGHDEPAMQSDMLAAGADCYVVKTGRLKPLIQAMDSPPTRRDPPASARPRPADHPEAGAAPDIGRHPVSTDEGRGRAAGRRGHQVFCYRHDRELTPHLAATATAALVDGGRFVIIATPEHRAALRAALPPGILDRAAGDGRFVDLDAAHTLSLFLRGGVPDPILFERTVGTQIRALAAVPGTLHAWGEMVSLLWNEGNLIGTLRLEQLWNKLQQQVAFELGCGYRIADLQDEADDGFAAICGMHTEISASRELESRRAG